MSFPRSRTRRFDSSCYRTRLSLESLESREVPATLVGLTTVGSLVEFDSSTPGTLIGSPVTVTGLMTGEHLVGVDYRPLNGILYGVSSGAHVYTINTSTGVATLVSPTAFTPALTGTSFAVNFNAVTDQLRVIGNDGQSLVINPSTGTATADTPPLLRSERSEWDQRWLFRLGIDSEQRFRRRGRVHKRLRQYREYEGQHPLRHR